jgi:hypothetical protein
MEALRLARVELIAARRLSVRRGLCASIGATAGRAATRDARAHARIAPVGAHGCTRSPRVGGAIGRLDALRGFGIGSGLCVGPCVVRDGCRGRRRAASKCLDKNRRGGEEEESRDIHEKNRSAKHGPCGRAALPPGLRYAFAPGRAGYDIAVRRVPRRPAARTCSPAPTRSVRRAPVSSRPDPSTSRTAL